MSISKTLITTKTIKEIIEALKTNKKAAHPSYDDQIRIAYALKCSIHKMTQVELGKILKKEQSQDDSTYQKYAKKLLDQAELKGFIL